MKSKQGSGAQKSGSLLYWLLRSPWKLGDGVAPLNVLQGYFQPEALSTQRRAASIRDKSIRSSAARSTSAYASTKPRRAAAGRPSLRRRFRRALRADAAQHGSTRASRTTIQYERTDVVATLRAVLAAACVTALEPDLVILDEFQRFRYLLGPARRGEQAGARALQL